MAAICARLAAPLLALAAAMQAGVAADSADLSGPNVIVFRHEPLPFVSSTRFVRQGTPTDGGCRYERGATTLGPGELPAGHALVTVVRAHDPVACRELVEQGFVLSPARRRPQTEGTSGNGGSGTLQTLSPEPMSTRIEAR